jgi:hypothetical protein
MPIPASIVERVETFRRNLESYLAADYKETELRREFLDPLFAALGWDVFNLQGYAEAYKDVVHEDMLKINGQSTAPDYSFRIGGARKFFVEAKKPAVRIKDDPAPAAQLRRYSWTAKLPLGIVTDFQEFAIYDTRIRPRADDKASTGRVFYCTFEEFPQKWDEIAAIFSKDAVLKGSFDKYAATNRGKRGTAEFDADFLADMENWRQLLAVNLAKRNTLDERELNFAVQRILDRIVFLRIAEDRGIEPLGQLQALTAGPRIYPRLREIFERADFRYNSGLFHFATERGRDEAPDRLTLGLELDDAVLKEVLSALYWPKSPYAFAVVSADILGNVYEQFLGKVIQLDGPHRVKVEEKPEVRKAGGVYYTPAYIVDYIVRQAVGPLVAGKTPKQVEKLRVLDPACGSGSFLLGAYEFLLAWHLDYYTKNEPAAWAKKKNPPIYETAPNAQGLGRGDGNWRLTTSERKRVLVNNIFGVDIDAQAVEVTKLSLLLKVLEGEARELQGKQLEFHRVLPDLGNNIKCGNSLIGPDFYAQPDLPELDEETRYKINAFDWAEEFKPVFAQGGFDAVIGNPPYVLLQDELRDDAQVSYHKIRYSSASFKIDLYHLFIEKGLLLLRDSGRLGFITPSNFLTNNHLTGLRRLLLTKAQVQELVVIDQGVFRGVSVDTALTIASITGAPSVPFPVRRAAPSPNSLVFGDTTEVDPGAALADKHSLLTGSASKASDGLWAKCARQSVILGEIAHVNFGKQLRDRKRFPQDVIEVASVDTVPASHHACLTGRNINRYVLAWGGLACLLSIEAQSGGCWDLARHEAKKKLITRQIGRTPFFALDDQGYHCLNTVFMVSLKTENYAPEYLLGLLNSKLHGFLWLERFYDKRGTFPKIKGTYLKLLPIRSLDSRHKADRARHDQLVALVERMLKLHAELPAAKSPDAQTRLQREIKATDAAIDRLVYELYELTPEEIALVEAATAPPVKPASAAEPEPGANPQAEADAGHRYTVDEETKPYV